jgi:hypothetical protein
MVTPDRWGFLTPPVEGADLRAALAANCLRGALPPVDLRAVCWLTILSFEWHAGASSKFTLVRAIVLCKALVGPHTHY